MTDSAPAIPAGGHVLEPARSEQQILGRLCSTATARLGWTFRDRMQFAKPHNIPEPPDVVVAPGLVRSSRLAEARAKDLPAIAGASLLVGATFAVTRAMGVSRLGLLPEALTVVQVMAPFVIGVGAWTGYVLVTRHQRQQKLDAAETLAGNLQSSKRQQWAEEREHQVDAELARLDAIPEWGPVTVTDHARVDIFGGSLRSWSGLLSTFLTSAAQPERPVLAVDLTGSQVTDEALHLCSLAQRTTERTLLPEGISRSQLLRDLDSARLTDLVIDLIHGSGDAERGENRILDTRVLRGICAVLEPDVTADRLNHALRELLGDPPGDSLLSNEEQTRISSVFSGDFVQQAHDRFRVLEAYTSQLLTSPAQEDHPTGGAAPLLRCIVLSRHGRATSDLLANVAIQWALREVEDGEIQTVVVAGGDRVPLALLERLSQRCEEHRVQLVVMFQHLRDDVTRFVGGGRAVGFMRLGNHLEAEAAANFVGRGHRFVLSQVTKGYGGQSSRGSSTQQGSSAQESAHINYEEPEGLVGRLFRRERETGRGISYSTSWGSSLQYTEGTNWSFSESSQRVYEYQVEPTQLQGLPDYTMLLVTSQADGPRITSIECCPDIVTLPGVSHQPFAPVEGPAADVHQLPAHGRGEPS